MVTAIRTSLRPGHARGRRDRPVELDALDDLGGPGGDVVSRGLEDGARPLASSPVPPPVPEPRARPPRRGRREPRKGVSPEGAAARDAALEAHGRVLDVIGDGEQVDPQLPVLLVGDISSSGRSRRSGLRPDGGWGSGSVFHEVFRGEPGVRPASSSSGSAGGFPRAAAGPRPGGGPRARRFPATDGPGCSPRCVSGTVIGTGGASRTFRTSSPKDRILTVDAGVIEAADEEGVEGPAKRRGSRPASY